MRIFTGIAIPPPITGRLETAVASLRPLAAIKWSPLSKLHITTKFIGAWPDDRLHELKHALGAARLPWNIRIDIAGFGFYPNPHKPKVFFASVNAPGLDSLHRAIENALEPLGCARDDRPFSPHLTLARIGHTDVRNLLQRVAEWKHPEFGSFTASEFHLYLSQPGPGGSVYTTLGSFALSEKEAIAC